jgi:hypothetical protein
MNLNVGKKTPKTQHAIFCMVAVNKIRYKNMDDINMVVEMKKRF